PAGRAAATGPVRATRGLGSGGGRPAARRDREPPGTAGTLAKSGCRWLAERGMLSAGNAPASRSVESIRMTVTRKAPSARVAEPLPLDSPLTSGDLELSDRRSLRRVAGLSTELGDVSEVEYRRLPLDRVVLVAVSTDGA